MLELVDSHCHIQFPNFEGKTDEYVDNALKAGVIRLITVGTDAKDSQSAAVVAASYKSVWFSIGLHPHEAKYLKRDKKPLNDLIGHPKLVAVGECGLDYHYLHSSKAEQMQALRWQIEQALEHDLPIIFHVREAYADFWKIFDEYKNIRGVCHCFSGADKEAQEIINRNLFIGLNGIVTFTKNADQLAALKTIPLQNIMLETDAPFLTPAPFRGKVNESKHVAVVAKFLGRLRGETLEEIASATTKNARRLFNI
jgi:TatD DNase family protein